MKLWDGQPSVSLAQPFEPEWRGRDAFSMVRALDGEVYRDVPGRRTLRFSAFGRSWFLKHHTGVGWKEVLGEWLRGRRPVTGADNEWHAIRALRAAGIDTMTAVAFGQRGGNPAARESFLITADLREESGEPMVDLETLCAGWVQKPPPVAFKRALLKRLAEISRCLHGAGITHRDYYLCHFLLPRSQLSERDSRGLTPVLIDLHRALLQPSRLRRWIEKDLAALWFSARYAGLTSRDLLRFLTVYHDCPLRPLLRRRPRSWQRMERRADAMLRREQIRQQRVRAQCLLPPPGSPVERWRYGTSEQREQIPRLLRMTLDRCHEAGWLPVDRALRDVREMDDRTVIELTGAGRLRDTLAPEKARQANLAAFLSWFPESVDARPDTPSPAMLRAARRDRWRRISPGLYRDSIQVRRWSGGGRVAVYKRRLGGPDWDAFLRDPDAVMRAGRMLKDGDTTTVAQL
ncbi:MAG: lipopolysaccharide core heptose(I) kinase RfaP, partial [Pseudomonadota bacterium]